MVALSLKLTKMGTHDTEVNAVINEVVRQIALSGLPQGMIYFGDVMTYTKIFIISALPKAIPPKASVAVLIETRGGRRLPLYIHAMVDQAALE